MGSEVAQECTTSREKSGAVREWREHKRERMGHFGMRMAPTRGMVSVDEVMPPSCAPRRWDRRSRGTLDDSLGDSWRRRWMRWTRLPSSGMLRSSGSAVAKVIENLNFDRDVVVSVFESNIRIIEGFICAHAPQRRGRAAAERRRPSILRGWTRAGPGNRLLPAFRTDSGIPVHRGICGRAPRRQRRHAPRRRGPCSSNLECSRLTG